MTTEIQQPATAVDNIVVMNIYTPEPSVAHHNSGRIVHDRPASKPSHTRRHYVSWQPGCLQENMAPDQTESTPCENNQIWTRSPVHGMRSLPIAPRPLKAPILTRMASAGAGSGSATKASLGDVSLHLGESSWANTETVAGDADDTAVPTRRPHGGQCGSARGAELNIALAAGIGIAVAAACTAFAASIL